MIDTPVTISDEAHAALTAKMRAWSGWADARLDFARPIPNAHATTLHSDHSFTADPETLILNPNRVLLRLTPFRLRQEAVLTGALLHEVGHARHSHWQAHRDGRGATLLHSDGTTAKPATIAFARLVEEPRIERCLASEADKVGAVDLAWTMRAAAAYLLPMTDVSDDPNQAVMDVLSSWVLRVGRQYAMQYATQYAMEWVSDKRDPTLTTYRLPEWVHAFNNLLHKVLSEHVQRNGQPANDATRARDMVVNMIRHAADTGTQMLDQARDVLDLLFPNDDAPEASGGCAGDQDESEEDEAGEDSNEDGGEGGTEDGQGGGEAGDEGESEGQGQGEDGSPADGSGGFQKPTTEAAQQMQASLNEMEQQADHAETEEADKTSVAPPKPAGRKGGEAGTPGQATLRDPTAQERAIKKNAERFLRNVIAPSDASSVSLTESPSSTVDGAALAAWKAGGQQRDPRFFKRTRRTTTPSVPVKIAVLVDVSGSMDVLQKPSAQLSWALASAALDLRNFAGRGVQVESTLIHWGSTARVIQANGKTLDGLPVFSCHEGTNALDAAHDLVAEQIPGFFDVGATPENRLLINFTDWELSPSLRYSVPLQLSKAFEAGVNMLTVAPSNYSHRSTDLPDILEAVTNMRRPQRGGSFFMKYNPVVPEAVWDTASSVLDGSTHPSGF